jgi:flavin-dependent dehydrogenase
VLTDLVVVGGGPAGLAAAIAARAHGLRCVVVERRFPPVDKTCGEGLMPDGLRALRRLDVAVTPGHGAPFAGIRFTDGAHTVDGRFAVEPGVGVRRPLLHHLLVEHAERAGVDLRWGSPGEWLDAHTVRVGREPIAARWIVGADGPQSHVRRRAGLEAGRRPRIRYAARGHYGVRPWSEYVEIHWGARGQFYVTPVGPEEICVVYVSRAPIQSLAAALADSPCLAARLAGAPATSRARGGLSITQILRRVVAGPVALVGDASGSVDAITGEGLSLAFRQAGALAAALAAGRLDDYQRAHARLGRRPRWMAALMLTLDRWPRFGRRALPALARTPRLFGELLALHVGERPRARVLIPEALRLGSRLLVPARSGAAAVR